MLCNRLTIDKALVVPSHAFKTCFRSLGGPVQVMFELRHMLHE